MKKYFILSFLLYGVVFSQQYEDVVYLKDGSEILGVIIEQKPNEYIKIQSGKNILVYRYDEIDLFRKELINKTKRYNLSDKTWSFAVGLGTNRNFSLLGISKDFKIGKQFSFFVTADIPVFIIIGEGEWGHGHALAGIGFSYQKYCNWLDNIFGIPCLKTFFLNSQKQFIPFDRDLRSCCLSVTAPRL